LAYGVIGNTAVFGSVIPGSSPGRPTEGDAKASPFFICMDEKPVPKRSEGSPGRPTEGIRKYPFFYVFAGLASSRYLSLKMIFPSC
jgi:hypothetical protein